MPKPVEGNQRYMPGLDGLRAVAVIAVIVYHLDFDWAPGGLLGVGVFFTLSGYLITDILLGQRESAGRLRLGNFWLRRARRLLPALFLLLAVVSVWVAILHPSRIPELRGEVLAAVLYISNWWYIFNDVSYFANFGPPPALGHLWSLAVEEQFYVVWPLLLWVGLLFSRGRNGHYYGLAILTLIGAALSATLMTMLYQPGIDPTRIYDGTDTRAFGLLVGAALAMVWPSRNLSFKLVSFRYRRVILDAAGIVGLAVIVYMILQTDQYAGFLYRGGMVILTVATALVVAVVAHPAARIGPVLGCLPLRWIGVRSYGIYLWHYPIIVLTAAPLGTETTLVRQLLQIGATIAAAALSWQFVEEPIRRGAIERFWRRIRSSGWRPWRVPLRNWAALVATLAVVLLASAGLAGAMGTGDTQANSTPPPGESGGKIEITSPEETTTTDAPEETTASEGTAAMDQYAEAEPEEKPEPKPQYRTSCESVAYIGDSTSEGMISANYLPKPEKRLDARFSQIGVENQSLDITGARSIVETLPGDVGGYDAAQNLKADGFSGCWVIALGGNDTANVSIGSQIGLEERIDEMMSVAEDEPVMWITVKTLLSDSPYANANMQLWNDALRASCEKYPNMRIYDWASAIDDSWFIEDGTHFTSQGYAQRSALTAKGLAEAFPAGGEKSENCVVD